MKKLIILLISLFALTLVLTSCDNPDSDLDRYYPTNTPSTGGTGGGSGDSSSGSCYCGAPTQSGGSCKRKVADCGRCWQHK